MAEDPLREEVLEILAAAATDHLGLDVDVRAIADDASLINLTMKGTTLDSLDFLVLVLAAEEHFDCDIEEPVLRTNPSWGQFVEVITSQVRATRRGGDGV